MGASELAPLRYALVAAGFPELHNFSRRAFRPPPEPMLIHWRRGLFRVWLLVSAGWVMGWTIFAAKGGKIGDLSSRSRRHFWRLSFLQLATELYFLA
jgi:hypothetical protein